MAWRAPRRRRAASIFAPIAQEVRFERFAEAERGIAASVLAGALARRVREARTRGAPQRRGQIAAFDVFNQSVSRRWRGVWEVIPRHWRCTDARRVLGELPRLRRQDEDHDFGRGVDVFARATGAAELVLG